MPGRCGPRGAPRGRGRCGGGAALPGPRLCWRARSDAAGIAVESERFRSASRRDCAGTCHRHPRVLGLLWNAVLVTDNQQLLYLPKGKEEK